MKKSVLILLMAQILMGCATLKGIFGLGLDQPKTRIVSIAVEKVTFGSLDLVVGIEVANPNDVEIKLNWLEYRISSSGHSLAEGVYRDAFEVPANGSKVIELPLGVDTRNAFNVMKIYLEEPKALGVQIDGKISFATALGDMEWTFQEEKTIGDVEGQGDEVE